MESLNGGSTKLRLAVEIYTEAIRITSMFNTMESGDTARWAHEQLSESYELAFARNTDREE